MYGFEKGGKMRSSLSSSLFILDTATSVTFGMYKIKYNTMNVLKWLPESMCHYLHLNDRFVSRSSMTTGFSYQLPVLPFRTGICKQTLAFRRGWMTCKSLFVSSLPWPLYIIQKYQRLVSTTLNVSVLIILWNTSQQSHREISSRGITNFSVASIDQHVP